MKFLGLGILLLMTACGAPEWQLRSLSAMQPHVVSMSPENSLVAPNTKFSLLLSVPVDEETLTEKSVLIIQSDASDSDFGNMKNLLKKISDQELASIPLSRSLSHDGKELSLEPQSPFSEGETYTILITSELMTEDLLPFNQRAGETAAPYLWTFQVTEDEGMASASPVSKGTPKAPISSGPNTTNQEPLPVMSETPQVVLNEIYYDAPGSDTDGVVFIELRGAAGLDLSGLQVLMINGDNGSITDSIILPTGSRITDSGLFVIADQSTGSSSSHVAIFDLIDNFDPQNGPDAIQIIFNGELLDCLAYGDVKVTQAENGLDIVEGVSAPSISSGHSLSRQEDAEDSQDNASDFFENTLPSPGIFDSI